MEFLGEMFLCKEKKIELVWAVHCTNIWFSYLDRAVIVKSEMEKNLFAKMCAFYFSKTRWNCFWNKGWTVLYLGVIILPLKQKFKDLVVQFLGSSLNVLLTKLQPSESTHQKVIWILYASWRLFKKSERIFGG